MESESSLYAVYSGRIISFPESLYGSIQCCDEDGEPPVRSACMLNSRSKKADLTDARRVAGPGRRAMYALHSALMRP